MATALKLLMKIAADWREHGLDQILTALCGQGNKRGQMKNKKMWLRMIVMVLAFGIMVVGCASNPPPQGQIRELRLNNGIYGPLPVERAQHNWFMVQPSVSGDLHVVIERALALEVYDSNNRRIARFSRDGRTGGRTRTLVIPVVASGSYLFRVDARHIHHTTNLYAFNESQRAEARRLAEETRRLAEEERRRVQAEREEERRQAELARQEQQQAEQNRLAELFRQAGQSQGNLRNTSWRFFNNLGRGAHEDARLDFGDGNYLIQENQHDFFFARTERGTFRVSGNTVIFRSDGGIYSFGTILGNTLEYGTGVLGTARIFR